MHSQQRSDAELRRIIKKMDGFVDSFLCVAVMLEMVAFFFIGVLYGGKCPEWAFVGFIAFMSVMVILAMMTGTTWGETIVYGGIEWSIAVIAMIIATPFVILAWGVTTVPSFFAWGNTWMVSLQKARHGKNHDKGDGH